MAQVPVVFVAAVLVLVVVALAFAVALAVVAEKEVGGSGLVRKVLSAPLAVPALFLT